MGQIIRGDTIRDEERIKLLNKIIAKLKEIEESIPVKIRQAIDALVDNSPETYDTLRELYEGLVLQPDWEQDDDTKLDFIKNKPTIPEQVKSDWNENDNTKASYIQNRTHYEDITTIPNYEYILNDKLSGTNRLGYKVISISQSIKDIEFYCEQDLITRERINLDESSGDYNALSATFRNIHYRTNGSSDGETGAYCEMRYYHQSQNVTINGESIYQTVVENGITYIILDQYGRSKANAIKYTKIEQVIQKLDIKYIPDSLIQRIEACEQALNITPNP